MAGSLGSHHHSTSKIFVRYKTYRSIHVSRWGSVLQHKHLSAFPGLAPHHSFRLRPPASSSLSFGGSKQGILWNCVRSRPRRYGVGSTKQYSAETHHRASLVGVHASNTTERPTGSSLSLYFAKSIRKLRPSKQTHAEKLLVETGTPNTHSN